MIALGSSPWFPLGVGRSPILRHTHHSYKESRTETSWYLRTSSLNFNAVEVAKVDVGSWAQRMRIRTVVGVACETIRLLG